MGDLLNVYDVAKTIPSSQIPPWRRLAHSVWLHRKNSPRVAKNLLQCASMQILIFCVLCTRYAPGKKYVLRQKAYRTFSGRCSGTPLWRNWGTPTLCTPQVGRDNASVRTGGRRRRSSPTPRCNGEDMVKVRQGKPVKKGSQRMQRGRQMTALRGWCTSPSVTANPPFQVDRPNWKAECAETCLLRLERGKGCKALPIATRHAA